jgi:hypothetical protein
VLETLVTAAARAMLVVWLLYALFPAPQEEAASVAPAGGGTATGMPVPEHDSAARTLAKVVIVLPAQLFYFAEPTALIFRDLGQWGALPVFAVHQEEINGNGK